MVKEERPDCLSCKHFFVTWDASAPRGCRIFDIKTPLLPSDVVFRATGRRCPSYEKNPGVKKENRNSRGSKPERDNGPGILV